MKTNSELINKTIIRNLKTWIRNGLRIFILLFAVLNLIAFFHAYKFTHFNEIPSKRTKDPEKLSRGQKLQALIFGISNPRPQNRTTPASTYKTVRLKSNKEIECWHIKTDSSKGTVILFHGFSSKKSDLLDKAEIFNKLGYSTLLVDFMGSGGSEGNKTTIGFSEAEQVKTCVDHLAQQGEQRIYLFGTSMGAVAIMKAIHTYQIMPEKIILECPFGSMYQTVCARFRMMKLPCFPMAGLLVFWGGIQNHFWAFGHQPVEYAKNINCPTLVLYGALDEKVSRRETDAIFSNLKGKKQLRVYETASHENYLIKYKEVWTRDVANFLLAE